MRCRLGVLTLSLLVAITFTGCGGTTGVKNEFAGTTITTPGLGAPNPSGTGNQPAPPGNSTPPSSPTTPPSPTPTPGSPTPPSSPTPTPTPPAPPPPSPTVGVVVTTPGDGASVTSPLQFVASASAGSAITAMHVYADSNLVFQTQSGQINTTLQLPSGDHSLIAQAWDANGNIYKSAAVNVTVSGAASPNLGPSNPSVGQIQTMPSWDSCSVCAGMGGNGPTTSHSMDEGIGSPSLSGAAARFNVGGTPWGAALWWKELGGHDDVQHFRYDVDFYVESISATQALEFDVNQNAGGNRYIFGTECDFRSSGTWRIWNSPAGQWVSSGVNCPTPQPGKWNHLTWEFQRSGGQVTFVGVTLNGDRHSVDRTFDAISQSGSGLDVAFQADLTGAGDDVSVWLDNVSLTWW